MNFPKARQRPDPDLARESGQALPGGWRQEPGWPDLGQAARRPGSARCQQPFQHASQPL